ncbi:nucleotide exchange factor GrpE [Leeia sp. TBRC 13508]|uniref:Protein GrpE n=1 Tax=Leeia speluncae TaxID=2884804 RepID=A0ABS8D186_9NEIS|nr:nucleotide exchange factor GrpE [Leeia speluncae]MCB6181964.1 nucleotide exchange factor GrpE [Leeia speluncae]
MSNDAQQENQTVETPTAEATATETPSIESQLASALEELEKARQDVLYAKAESDNARRRAQDEVDKARKFAVEKFASELLAVKDSLEMALKDNSSIENIKAGVDLTLKQLSGAFEKFAVREINPVGEKLDPHKHQAMTVVPVADKEPNTVIDVMQKGYTLADRVIRPALVVVSKAP